MIAETLRLQQQLVDAAGDWKRTRVGIAIATTQPGFSRDVAPLLALHDRAIDRLAAAVDELEARDTLPLAGGMSSARTVVLETRVINRAITWYAIRSELLTDDVREPVLAEATDELSARVGELVGELMGGARL